MTGERPGDVVVDVLVIGAGIQGLHVAQSLRDRYTLCVVSDPAVGAATLESGGHFSAGYEGNDAVRIQPARRAAGFWRMWAEAHDLDTTTPCYYVVPPDEALSRPRLWDDATLRYHPTELPAPFDGGALSGWAPYQLDDDVVVDTAAVLRAERSGLDELCIEGKVLRFGLVADRYIDHVQVDVDGEVVPIVPRYVVLAAGVSNAELLGMIGKRFDDQALRKSSQETARASQAVQRATVLCVRGDLPLIAGWFGDLWIAAHPSAGGGVVWLVQLPPDHGLTSLGPQDLRFDAPVESVVVAETVEQLFAVAPGIEALAPGAEWGVYTARRTIHPWLGGPDPASVATPVPAKLEGLGLDACLALWPSHLGFAMVLGDVVAERVADALGAPEDDADAALVAELAAQREPPRARWDRDDFVWEDWSTFASTHDVKSR